MGDDLFMEDLGGCGMFQVILVIILSLGEVTAPFTMMFMVFGAYNPGWRCLDNANLTDTNDTVSEVNDTTSIWHKSGSCSEFKSCKNVQFNPDSSTLVTEWGLICDQFWIPSLIITIQMAGVLVGSYLLGYAADKIGRKRAFCMAILVNAMLNLLTYFSVNWQMFAVIRFFLGVTHSCITVTPYILSSEFSSWKWRSVISGLPVWGIGGTFFALTAMLLKDWRQIHLVTFILTFVVFFPTIWAPESIRWLALKGETKKVEAVAKKIARTNRQPLPDKTYFDTLMKSIHQTTDDSCKYSWRHMWRGKALKYTLVFTPIWFTISLTYYSLSFGIRSLTGNFYTNLMVIFVTELPIFFLSAYVPNLLGRKRAVLCHSFFNTASFIAMVLFDKLPLVEESGLVILVLVLGVRIIVNGQWYICYVFQSELYPTVIRSTSLGYASSVARVGGMTAPYLIPDDPDTHFISYSVMATLTFFCSFLVFLLPETKGKNLMDIWDDDPGSEERNETTTKRECLVT